MRIGQRVEVMSRQSARGQDKHNSRILSSVRVRLMRCVGESSASCRFIYSGSVASYACCPFAIISCRFIGMSPGTVRAFPTVPVTPSRTPRTARRYRLGDCGLNAAQRINIKHCETVAAEARHKVVGEGFTWIPACPRGLDVGNKRFPPLGGGGL